MVAISLLSAGLFVAASVNAVPMRLKRDTKPFTLANGQAAQALNAKFASTKAGDSCTADQCIGGSLGQCANGQLVATPCAGGTQCFALPLVNKAGTSIACDTEADAAARIAATGATGGITGSGSASDSPSSTASDPASSTASDPASASASGSPSATASDPASATTSGSASATASDSASATASATATAASGAAPSPSAGAPPGAQSFTLANGKAAQALNVQFASLSTNSACTTGQQACVDGQFAQCVSGRFQTSACGSGLQCFALPLVNKAGTTISCTTQADAAARFAATGAGGITG